MSKFQTTEEGELAHRGLLRGYVASRMKETGLDESAARDLVLREMQTDQITDAIDRLTEQLKRVPLRVVD